jgi:hypothetical protein
MAPDNPNNPSEQVDISLQLMDESHKKVLDSFVESVGSLQNLMTQIKTGIADLSKLVPQGQEQGAAGGVSATASTPAQAAAAQASFAGSGSAASGAYQSASDAQTTQQLPSGLGGFLANRGAYSAGNIEQPPPYDPNASDLQNRLNASPAIRQPYQMPRYGEFTIQDLLGVLTKMTGAGRNLGGPVGAASTGVGGALDIARQYSPYAATLGQFLGIPGDIIKPSGTAQLMQNFGVTANTGIAAYQPGNMLNQGKFTLGMTGQALGMVTGSGGRITPDEAWQAMSQLGGEGIRPGAEMDQYTGMYQRIRTAGQALPENWAQLAREGTRQGTPGSWNQTEKALTGLMDAADKAGVSIDQMGQSVAQVSEELTNMGATKGAAENAAVQFSSITGMPPEVQTQAMQNPLWQAAYIGQGGFPGLEGLFASKDPAAATRLTSQTAGQYMKMFRGTFQNQKIKTQYGTTVISGKEQDQALAAQMMGVSPDQFKQILRQQKASRELGNLSEGLSGYQAEADAINKMPDGPRKTRLMDQLNAGTGRFAGKGVNQWSWKDIQQMAQSGQGPISIQDIHKIEQQAKSPEDRAKLLDKKLKQTNLQGSNVEQPGKTTSMNGITIGLDSRASQFFKILTGNQVKQQGTRNRNSGQEASGKGLSQLPSQAQGMVAQLTDVGVKPTDAIKVANTLPDWAFGG